MHGKDFTMSKKLTGKGEKIRQKMIETTAKILREQGFKSATVRAIAKASIASIKYYFGSKEDLIGQSLDYMMGNFENIVAYLDDPRLSPKERLTKYILAYFELARKHPALFHSISHPSTEESKDTYFIYLTLLHNQCWNKIKRNISELTNIKDSLDLELKSMQLFSAIEFPIILEANKTDSFVTQYADPNILKRYIELLLDMPCKKD